MMKGTTGQRGIDKVFEALKTLEAHLEANLGAIELEARVFPSTAESVDAKAELKRFAEHIGVDAASFDAKYPGRHVWPSVGAGTPYSKFNTQDVERCGTMDKPCGSPIEVERAYLAFSHPEALSVVLTDDHSHYVKGTTRSPLKDAALEALGLRDAAERPLFGAGGPVRSRRSNWIAWREVQRRAAHATPAAIGR